MDKKFNSLSLSLSQSEVNWATPRKCTKEGGGSGQTCSSEVREAIIKAKELGYTKMIIPNASKEIQLFWKEKNRWPWWIIANIILRI